MRIWNRSDSVVLLLAIGIVLAGCSAQAAAVPTSTPTSEAPSATALPSLSASPLPQPSCDQARGRYEEHSLDTELLYRPLMFRVYLPPCYSPQRSPGYPLLILLHGQGADASQWDRLGADEALETLIASGESDGMILVMPYEQYDLLPPRQTRYDEAIAGPLLDWLRASYAVCAERSCTAVGGLSRGGAWAVRIGFEAWPTFGAVGAHSLPPFPDEISRIERLLKQTSTIELPRLYLDIGRKDIWRDAALEFHDFLQAQRIPHTWVLNEGRHEEAYWQAHMLEYMLWYNSVLKTARP